LTFVADGSASNLRKVQTDRAPFARSKFYGLELIDTTLPKPQHGHVLLGDFSPILLYQIGTHETRILIDIPDATVASLKSRGQGVPTYMRDVVLPVLPDSVKPAFEKAVEAGNTKAVPNHWLPPKMSRVPGVVVLGDAMNMRHPLTGGGMTVAFNDAVLISNLLSPDHVPDLGNTKLVLEQMKKFHWQRKDVTSTINILAQALYSLFAANGESFNTRQSIQLTTL
jgi:squalene monooxygenase